MAVVVSRISLSFYTVFKCIIFVSDVCACVCVCVCVSCAMPVHSITFFIHKIYEHVWTHTHISGVWSTYVWSIYVHIRKHTHIHIRSVITVAVLHVYTLQTFGGGAKHLERARAPCSRSRGTSSARKAACYSWSAPWTSLRPKLKLLKAPRTVTVTSSTPRIPTTRYASHSRLLPRASYVGRFCLDTTSLLPLYLVSSDTFAYSGTVTSSTHLTPWQPSFRALLYLLHIKYK